MGKLVFTNGCFDILHAGHVDFLGRAAAFGERLVVGINSDESVTRIKGVGRPVNTAEARRAVLLGLAAVDDVVIFAEPTPERLIHEISPDVLVKGGDWPVEQIIGADFVLAKGGEVHSIPLLGNYSTSAVIEKIAAHDAGSPDGPESAALQAIEEHLLVMQEMRRVCLDAIERSGSAIVDALSSGNKILICGNGGSAADAQHIAAELVGRFEGERRGLPAIALTTDTSALTAIGNDYGFEFLYSRQVEALAKAGDVVVCISTSGNSPNILAACMKARQIGCTTIALTGAGGSKLASLCDEAVLVPSQRTARIQEGHITIGHIWCGMVDAALGESA